MLNPHVPLPDPDAAETALVLGYLDAIARQAAVLPIAAILALVEVLDVARRHGRKVLLCGNGGSGATASHWANDLSKGAAGPLRPRLRALALADGVPLLTALANDLTYEQVFAEQVLTWAEPGDVLIAISGSGNSPNILRAVACGRQRGAYTVGLLGRDGGRLGDQVDLALVVANPCMEQIEDAHLIISHVVTSALRERAQGAAPLTVVRRESHGGGA
jgi:D-sedoheptulose 7-phosphate isomerase